MPWARFDERYPSHRKVRPLSDAAFRLDVSAVCWSSEHLTDGLVRREELRIVSDVKRPTAAAAELVRLGRWDEVDDGWRIHDFHVYNPTADKVRRDRAEAAERQRRAREASRSRRESREQSQRDTDRDSRPGHSAVTVPPTRPDPTRSSPDVDPSPPVPLREPTASGQEHPAERVRAARKRAGLALDGWTDQACTTAVLACKGLVPDQHTAWQALAVIAAMPDTTAPGRLPHKLDDALTVLRQRQVQDGNRRAELRARAERDRAAAEAARVDQAAAAARAREALAAAQAAKPTESSLPTGARA